MSANWSSVRAPPTPNRAEQQHRVIARLKRDDRRSGRETRDDPWNRVMKVDAPHRPAPPRASPPQPRVGSHSQEREQEGEQQEKQRLPSRPKDVILIAGDEMEEVRHARQSSPSPRTCPTHLPTKDRLDVRSGWTRPRRRLA